MVMYERGVFMEHVLQKKDMSEEDIKFRYITPAVTAKWDAGKITMETPITDGQISLKGNLVIRKRPKKADYIPSVEEKDAGR